VRTLSYLFGSGWWVAWYLPLWLAVSPFVVMTMGLTRALPDEPMMLMENAFAVSAVGLAVLMLGTVISGYFWTAGSQASGVGLYVRNIVLATAAAFIVGLLLVFGAGFMAVTPKQPMSSRWGAQIVCLASAGLMLAFCLHATWRFRHRQ
jgi:hypothetical protein